MANLRNGMYLYGELGAREGVDSDMRRRCKTLQGQLSRDMKHHHICTVKDHSVCRVKGQGDGSMTYNEQAWGPGERKW